MKPSQKITWFTFQIKPQLTYKLETVSNKVIIEMIQQLYNNTFKKAYMV